MILYKLHKAKFEVLTIMTTFEASSKPFLSQTAAVFMDALES
jgi:hypothetical protein